MCNKSLSTCIKSPVVRPYVSRGMKGQCSPAVTGPQRVWNIIVMPLLQEGLSYKSSYYSMCDIAKILWVVLISDDWSLWFFSKKKRKVISSGFALLCKKHSELWSSNCKLPPPTKPFMTDMYACMLFWKGFIDKYKLKNTSKNYAQWNTQGQMQGCL